MTIKRKFVKWITVISYDEMLTISLKVILYLLPWKYSHNILLSEKIS